MSRPPLAPRITETLYDMYQDARQINALTSETDLERKLAIINSVNEKIQRRIDEASNSRRPDPFLQRRLQTALEENQTIQSSVEGSLRAIRGSAGDRVALTRQLDDQAKRIAALQSELDRRGRDKESQIQSLSTELSGVKSLLDRLRGELEEKEIQLSSLRKLHTRVDNDKLQSRIDQLTLELQLDKAKYTKSILDFERLLNQKQLEQETCQKELDMCQLRSNELSSRISELERLLEQCRMQAASLPQPKAHEESEREQELRLELERCRDAAKQTTREKEELLVEIRRLEAEYNALVREREQLEQVSETRKRELERAMVNLAECEEEKGKLKQEINRLKSLLEDEQNTLQQQKLQQEKDNLIQQRKEEEKEHKDEIARLTTRIEAITNSLSDEKQSAVETLNKQLSEVQTKLDKEEDMHRRLQERVISLEADTKNLAEERKKSDELNAKIQELLQQKSELEKRLKTKSFEAEAAQSALELSRSRMQKLQDELQKLRDLSNKQQRDIDLKNAEISRIEKELDLLRSAAQKSSQTGEDLAVRLSKLEEETRDLSQQRNELQVQLSREQVTSAERESQLKEVKAELQAVNDQLQTISLKEQQLEEENVKVSAQLKIAERVKSEKEEELREKKSECDKRQAELQDQIVILNQRVQSLVSEQKQQEDTAQQEKKALSDRIEMLQAEVQQEQRRLSQLAEKNQAEQAQVLSSQIAEKNSIIAKLEKEFSEKEESFRQQLSKKDEQLESGLKQKDASLQEQISVLRQKSEEKLQEVQQELSEIRQQRDQAISEFQQTRDTLSNQKEQLEQKIASLIQEKEAERDDFQKALGVVQEKLRVSEDQQKAFQQQIQAYQRVPGLESPEIAEKKVKEQAAQIKETTKRLEEFEKEAKATIETLQSEAKERLKSIDEMATSHQRQLQDEKETSLREKQQLQAEHDKLLSEKSGMQVELDTLSGMTQDLREKKEEYRKRIKELEDSYAELEEKFSSELKKKCPSAVGDLRKILLDGLEKVEVVDVTDQQINDLQENMIAAIRLYSSSTNDSVVDIQVDQSFGREKMKQYILPVVYLFHAWKCFLRIPFVLRSGIPIADRGYFYDVPKNEIEEQFFLMISSEKIIRSYQEKIQEGKLRIDVLLYFVIIALMKNVGLSHATEQYRGLIDYLKKMIDYANETLVQLSAKVIDLIRLAADTVREKHNEQSPIVTFLRLSSKTPYDNNKRFDFKIYYDKVFHTLYSSQDEALYEKNSAGEMVLKKNQPINYTADYHFGPFTRIFEATDTNDVIVRNRVFQSTIEDRLRQGEPVCIIGYGASGSGKTTTLVYADYTVMEGGKPVRVQLPGILILLAQNLAKPKGAHRGYNKCEVKIYEMEAVTTADGKIERVCRKFPSRGGSVIVRDVRTETGGAKGDVVVSNPVAFSFCSDEKDDSMLEYENVGGVWKRSGEGLEKELVDYINIKRNIAPSPNNPQSSRSHVIACLVFSDSAGNKTTLLVCDFAGVENRFNCDDPDSLRIMGYPFLLEKEKKSYIDRAKAYLTSTLQKNVFGAVDAVGIKPVLNLPKLFANEIGLVNYKPVSEPYDILLTRKDGAIVNQPLQDIFALYQYVYQELLSVTWNKANATTGDSYPYVSAITGGVGQTIDLDITKINLSHDKLFEVEKSLKGSVINPALMKIPTVKALDAAVRENNGYKFIQKQYASRFTMPQVVNFHVILRIINWFFTSYRDPEDPLRYPLLDIIIQSHISSVLQGMPKKPDEPEEKGDKILPKERVDRFMQQSICQTRVNEGIYINESLAQLRRFISDTIQSTRAKGSVAPFIDVCAPLQCNPYYRDCFGQTDYFDALQKPFSLKQAKEYGLLSEYIMKVDNADKMTFCIINVVNLSKDANNPPKSPFIDITRLQIEYEKLLAYLEPNHARDELLLGMSKGLTPALTSAVTNLLQDLPSIRGTDDILRELTPYAEQLLQGNNLRDNLAKVIDVMTNFNAITAIGTLEFTDMMAKFAINRVTCNLTPDSGRPVARPLAASSSASKLPSTPKVQPPPSPNRPVTRGITKPVGFYKV